mgnify:FL=1|jgi:hypothetical protein
MNQWYANMQLGPGKYPGVTSVCHEPDAVQPPDGSRPMRDHCYKSGLLHTHDKRNRVDITAEVAEAFIQTHKAARWFFYWAPYGPHHPMLEDGDAYLESFRKVFKPHSFYTATENDARCRGLAL